MRNLEKLSDYQLINLYLGGNIDDLLKIKIVNEIERRDLKLVSGFKSFISTKQKYFVFFSTIFLFKYHIKIGNSFLTNGNKNLYNEYWRWFSFGVGLKFIVLIIVAKYLFSPNF